MRSPSYRSSGCSTPLKRFPSSNPMDWDITVTAPHAPPPLTKEILGFEPATRMVHTTEHGNIDFPETTYVRPQWSEPHPKLEESFNKEYLENVNSDVGLRGDPTGEAPWTTISEVQPNYFLGGEEATRNRNSLQKLGVKLVINMCAEKYRVDASPYKKWNTEGKRHENCESEEEFLTLLRDACLTPYTRGGDTDDGTSSHEDQPLLCLYIAADDVPSYDMAQHLHQTCQIQEFVFTLRDAMKKYYEVNHPDVKLIPPAVAVHCMAGVSRSSTVVCSYLMKKHLASRDDVITQVRKRRPIIRPNNGFMNALMLFEHCGYSRLVNESAISGIVHHLMKSSPIERVGFLRSYVGIMLSYSVEDDRKLFGRLLQELLRFPTKLVEQHTGLEDAKKGDATAAPDGEEGNAAAPDGGSDRVKKLRKAQHVPTTAGDMSSVLFMTMTENIRNQDYIDSPKMFEWWCHLCHSITCHSPVVMYSAALDEDQVETVKIVAASPLNQSNTIDDDKMEEDPLLSNDDDDANTSIAAATWSDTIHQAVLRELVTDTSNDDPLPALFQLMANIANEYNRGVNEHRQQAELMDVNKLPRSASLSSYSNPRTPNSPFAGLGSSPLFGGSQTPVTPFPPPPPPASTSPVILYASGGDMEANQNTALQLVQHDAFNTFRASFPLSAMLTAAAYKSALLDEQGPAAAGTTASDTNTKKDPVSQEVLVARQLAIVKSIKEVLRDSSLSEDIELFVLQSLFVTISAMPPPHLCGGDSKEDDADPSPSVTPPALSPTACPGAMMIQGEWTTMLDNLKAEHENSQLVCELTVKALIKKLATAIVSALCILTVTSSGDGHTRAPTQQPLNALNRLRQCVMTDRPQDVDHIDSALLAAVEFFEDILGDVGGVEEDAIGRKLRSALRLSNQ